MAAGGLALAAANFGFAITSLYAFGLFLGTIYSVPPLRLKRFAVPAFLIIATVRLSPSNALVLVSVFAVDEMGCSLITRSVFVHLIEHGGIHCGICLSVLMFLCMWFAKPITLSALGVCRCEVFC